MGFGLSGHERSELRRIIREQSGEARVYRRARMVLLAAGGGRVTEIAQALGTSRARVGEWLKRFDGERLDGLADAPRVGRPREISSLERHQVIATACQPPQEFGLVRIRWTLASLQEVLVSKRLVRSISRSMVGQILDEAEIKPHRVRMWCHSEDPDFQKKMRAIVRLYVSPPRGVPVLCIDEKTGMQALSRARAMQPPRPARDARFEFEYKRNGTRVLFACFDIRTGKVLGRCTEKRKRPDFFAFMDLVASKYRQPRVHVVVDNLNTHRDTTKGAFVTAWNRRHGNRFLFHYTPTHGSWLNQVELWFGIMTRRVLRYGNFSCPDALIAGVEGFIDNWNAHEAHPFRWTYKGTPLVR